MQPVTLVLDSADYHTLKRALATEHDELTALQGSDLGADAKASFKDSLDRVDAMLARLDALALEALKAEHGTMDLPPGQPR
jgi:hypothetical protein